MSIPTIVIDHADFKARAEQFRRDLGKVPKEMRTTLRQSLRRIAGDIVREGQSNAAWSDAIPGAFRVETRLGGSQMPGVVIKVLNRGESSHARPYEGIGGNDTFRHPVFADAWNKVRREWTWVEQATKPYLVPAVVGSQDAVLAEMEKAVYVALVNAGFRP